MSMTFVQQAGRGADVVLVHGWGLHGGILEGLAHELMSSYRVTIVDLPGHGRSRLMPGDELNRQSILQSLSEVTPQTATWIGWSLGGMLAMEMALTAPQRVSGLITFATSPRFVRSDDWPNAMQPEQLAGFAEQLTRDWQGTLKNFLALQMLGSDGAREHIRYLQEHMLRYGEPNRAALECGLEILQQTDLRDRLAELQCPSLFVYGELDRLVPAAVAGDIRRLLPNAGVVVVPHAGHAPFISHFDDAVKRIRHFLMRLASSAGAQAS
ncbi:MAG: pimeloyl-ACP methyl ester esterase BioH [Gammaproteobacteria bacterium]|nr:MAG: pimeloyl-ACP methyl ester esterase BioH [Gammaproteobacteria bacterium]